MALRKHETKNGHSWEVTIELGDDPDTGERRRTSKRFPNITKKQAERIEREMLADAENGTLIRDTSISVATFLREWHTVYIAPFKSPTTTETYLQNLERYIIPVFGKLKLQDLTTIKIQKWVNNLSVKSPLSDKPLSPKSVRNLFMNLNAPLKHAVEMEYIKKNPATRIVLPQCTKYKPEVYNAQEIGMLINALKDTEIQYGIMVMVILGIRRGEALSLSFSDIDFDNNVVHITKSLVKVTSSKTVVKSPKSTSGIRSIDCPLVLMDLLRKAKHDYLIRKLRYGPDFKDTNLVVCRPDGSAFAPDLFTKKFKKLLVANGLRVIRLHDLRHTAATYLLKLGVDMKVIQARLGHSDYSITANLYAHVLDDMSKEAADTLNAGLESIISTAR